MFARLTIVLYSIGTFALNVAVALVLPQVIIASLRIQSDWESRAGILHVEIIASAIAFIAGLVSQKIWHPRAARWIWMVGWVWLVWVSYMYWREHASMNILDGPARHSIWWMISGDACASDRRECGNWYFALLPLFRTAAYSLAAWCVARFHGEPAVQVDALRELTNGMREISLAEEQLPASRKTLFAIGLWIYLAGALVASRFFLEPKGKLLLAGQLVAPAGLFIMALAEKERWRRLLLCVFGAWMLYGAWKTLHMFALQRLTVH